MIPHQRASSRRFDLTPVSEEEACFGTICKGYETRERWTAAMGHASSNYTKRNDTRWVWRMGADELARQAGNPTNCWKRIWPTQMFRCFRFFSDFISSNFSERRSILSTKNEKSMKNPPKITKTTENQPKILINTTFIFRISSASYFLLFCFFVSSSVLKLFVT